MEAAPLGTSYDVGGVDASPGSWPVGMIGLWPYALSRLPQNFAVCDGTKGTPDLRGLLPLGVDGSHALLSTGGSGAAVHGHTFTHESAHAITQPIFATPDGHGIPTQHPATEIQLGAGAFLGAASGVYFVGSGTPGQLTTDLQHAVLDHNHTGAARTTDVALTNNAPHAGGAVGNATGGLPPYIALHYVMRLA